MTAIVTDDIAFDTLVDASNDSYRRDRNGELSFQAFSGNRSATLTAAIRAIIQSKRTVVFTNGTKARITNQKTRTLVPGWACSPTGKSPRELAALQKQDKPDDRTNANVLAHVPVNAACTSIVAASHRNASSYSTRTTAWTRSYRHHQPL